MNLKSIIEEAQEEFDKTFYVSSKWWNASDIKDFLATQITQAIEKFYEEVKPERLEKGDPFYIDCSDGCIASLQQAKDKFFKQ